MRKLVRRLSPEVVAELTRVASARPNGKPALLLVRCGSTTVVEADIRYPANSVLALQGARALAREGRRLRSPTCGWWTVAADRQAGAEDLQDLAGALAQTARARPPPLCARFPHSPQRPDGLTPTPFLRGRALG